MLLLAVDTAAVACSVAVARDGDLLAETTLARRETHSRHLMGMITGTLAMAGEPLDALDGLVVCRGPGSFTGLRIGISTVGGLAAALQKPVVGVSALEALARQCATDLPVRSLIDARRREVYTGAFAVLQGRWSRLDDDRVAPPEAVVAAVEAPTLLVGSGARAFRAFLRQRLGARAVFGPPLHDVLRAASLIAVARDRFASLPAGGAGSVRPLYLRRSDAEVSRGASEP